MAVCACVGEMRDRERGILGVPGCARLYAHVFLFSFFALRREERRPNVYIRGKLALFGALWICQDSFPVIGCEDSSLSKIDAVVYVLECSAMGLRSLV